MKIAFLKFAGLGIGGVERYLQSIALLVNAEGHEVDYYYTNSAPIVGVDWTHPPNDPLREEALKNAGINLIKVKVGYKNYDPTAPQGEVWQDSDIFEKFDENQYDLLFIAGNGKADYPASQFRNVKTVYSVHGDNVYDQDNIIKSLLICEWQSKRWLSNGGNQSKLEIVPPIVEIPETYPTNFRQKYKIPKDAFVFGMHQRDDPSIFSPVSLMAFSQLQDPSNYMVILGGSQRHRDLVRSWPEDKRDRVVFLDSTAHKSLIHSFLHGIDVYAHSRLDGEVCSTAIVEAMAHGKVIISCPGTNNGHQEQIADCGFFCSSLEEYISSMEALRTDKKMYKRLSQKTKDRYNNLYSYSCVKEKVATLLYNLAS
jgi:glycosyltransferase involved in cell wall biosynthesis|tara:strand:- start:3391 stop:4497 length:1107 start_codon:yes stop_codon:yes gene_type:complete